MKLSTSSTIYTTRLLKRRWLSENTFEIELTRPDSFDFTPGQHIRFVQGSTEKEYSLISVPSDSTLSLLIRNMKQGKFSSFLATAQIGTRFSFTGPHGYLTFQASNRLPVFVATGTGIAPFISMTRSGVSGFILLHGGRVPSDLYYTSFLQSVGQQYIPCLSRMHGQPLASYNGFRGRVTEYLEKYLPIKRYDFYLCGLREMIRDATFVIDERFPDSFLKTEVFY
jgi:NAD(P)H-flavin reductase